MPSDIKALDSLHLLELSFISNSLIENSDSNSHVIEISNLNYSILIIDFEEKAFEDHLNAAISHLKYDLSLYYSTSKTSSTDASDFSFLIRLDSTIKDASMVLDKEI